MDGKPPTYDELIDLTRRQARQIDELRAEVERLKAELEQSRRAGERQAAPFSKGAPKAQPKRPGRKPGHTPSHRPAPPSEQVDRTIEVPVTQPTSCGFVGADLSTLVITTASQRLSPEALQSQPLAGALLSIPVGVRGCAEAEYAG